MDLDHGPSLSREALRFAPVKLAASTRPHLFVIVDTEEEFDWGAPFSKENTSVTAIRHIDRLQRVLARHRVQPTYVVDFPVSSQPDGYGPLKEIADSGACRIGAHLHPWVNPPFVEEVNIRNSYAFRLGRQLEQAKLKALQSEIADRFGRMPIVYKAGRYGFGVSTMTALEALHFRIDASINPQISFVADGGPSFEAFDAAPFFFGDRLRLLELPCSTGYSGICGRVAPHLHRLTARRVFEPLHLVGIMARLRIVDKVMLSPEGATLREMKALTTALLRSGIRTFSLTMHSPSVLPGCTPYVRTAADLAGFLDRVDAYCEFFFGELGGCASTPEDFLSFLECEAS
jgi:hypothetical protein